MNILGELKVLVGESLETIKVVEYTREKLAFRYILIFNWKVTLLAKNFRTLFPNGFPMSANEKFPTEFVFTFKLGPFFKKTYRIPMEFLKEFIKKLI